jgi:hypothetical protein
MKIRGNTVGTPINPKKVLVRSENLTEEEKAIARANIGAAAIGEGGGTLSAGIIDNVLVVTLPGNLMASIQEGVLIVA